MPLHNYNKRHDNSSKINKKSPQAAVIELAKPNKKAVENFESK